MERRFRPKADYGNGWKEPDRSIQTHPERLDIPLKRKKPTVYSIWNDLHHESNDKYFIAAAYGIASICFRHTFLILTKRPDQMLKFHHASGTMNHWVINEALSRLREDTKVSTFGIRKGLEYPWPLPNVWNGLTVCNQAEADEKLPIFLQVPGKKFLSIEPLLGEIDIDQYLRCPVCGYTPHDVGFHMDHRLCKGPGPGINAVILGGETGPGARPMHPDWVRKVRDDCAAAGVPFFFKSWGEWKPAIVEDDPQMESGRFYYHPLGGKHAACIRERSKCPFRSGKYRSMQPGDQTVGGVHMLDINTVTIRVGKNKAGRLLDGRTHDDLPWVKSKEVVA
jgi:protein gp37